jgi:hypothetical protein
VVPPCWVLPVPHDPRLTEDAAAGDCATTTARDEDDDDDHLGHRFMSRFSSGQVAAAACVVSYTRR